MNCISIAGIHMDEDPGALVYINTDNIHDDGPVFRLNDRAHVIVHMKWMSIEVHICYTPDKLLSAWDGMMLVDCDICGNVHEYRTGAEYLDAAERQGVPVDYV